jgi:hypothetical protein
MQQQLCPKCMVMLDAATNASGHNAPVPGDFTVCINCAAILTFDTDMQLLPAELGDIPTYVRSKFARLKMLIEERNRGTNISKL